MRLNQIKIAGFKSFVDPTKINFPANLTGIVGPNGCGKSNVIDAVRWVMGESSAKHLRGESMDDVIFSGSSSRKSIGQATVELVFDNTQGRAQGEYAKFNEISVKRIVSRDGQSKYFLNNTRCRRRDIADLFMGTGLGPRSYAIIEQGMISRIIDAKPEELRVYFEEAAGISKYKERRRETANRIKHTRENLERLTDLREEVEKQLKRLDRQAKTADKFKLLKKQQKRVEAELLVLQHTQVSVQHTNLASVLTQSQLKIDESITVLRKIEAELERIRDQLIESNEAQNSVQGEFYRIGSEIASTEQNISHTKQQQQQNQNAITQLSQQSEHKNRLIKDYESKLTQLEKLSVELKPLIDQIKLRLDQYEMMLNDSESAMNQWQQEWDNFNQSYHAQHQSVQLENKSIELFEKQLAQNEQKQKFLIQEQETIDATAYISEIEVLNQTIQKFSTQIESLQKSLNDQQIHIADKRENISHKESHLDKARIQVQTLRGKLSSLNTLQSNALDKSSSGISSWLETLESKKPTQLAENLSVETGYEIALESVLADSLSAYCISNDISNDQIKSRSEDFQLIQPLASKEATPTKNDWVLLASKTKSEFLPAGLLNQIYLCEIEHDLPQMRVQLNDDESIITLEGIWYGKNWVKKPGEAQDSVLRREKEITEIKNQLDQITDNAVKLKDTLDLDKEKLVEHEKSIHQNQQQIHQLQKSLASNQQVKTQKVERQQQLTQRLEKIQIDLNELKSERTEIASELQKSTLKRNDYVHVINDLEDKKKVIYSKKETLTEQLRNNRAAYKSENESLQAKQIELQKTESERLSITQNLQHSNHDQNELKQKLDDLTLVTHNSLEPLEALEEKLKQNLALKETQQVLLQKAQQKVTDLDQEQRKNETLRSSQSQDIESKRQLAEGEKLKLQELKVRISTIEEQLDKTDFNIQSLSEEIDDSASIESHQTDLNQLMLKIQHLGQINLAAIDEFEEQSERKQYLDEQNADLNKSLDTLESAIKKIDRETKDRFKDIFDQVNERMKIRFPKLFGGGEAHLELTENDLLTTGVEILARPPGKKINSLQLLSGGEKALTAVALIFAIFELNPSPFCMLDEVDAPLDDANVGRFCAMVKEMSEQVQFVFISHNKITMELAENLNGVTMHEPGVSRLVSVNITEASKLVD